MDSPGEEGRACCVMLDEKCAGVMIGGGSSPRGDHEEPGNT